jgi:SAM-dependent methyltransferase
MASTTAGRRTARSREWFRAFFDREYVAALDHEKPPRQTRVEVDFLLRALRLPPGARILDVACGTGRHAGALARRGYRVVGIDLSPAMLDEARRRFTQSARLRFRRLDMRRLAFREEFDAVVSLYTSFGYFAPAENEATLRRMARALAPGGKLLVDHRDPRYEARLPARLWYRAGPGRFVLERRRFDGRTKVTVATQLLVTAGRVSAVERRYRLQEFSLSGWRRMLRGAGLSFVRAYGAYSGRAYRPGATGRLIVVAERRADERGAIDGP